MNQGSPSTPSCGTVSTFKFQRSLLQQSSTTHKEVHIMARYIISLPVLLLSLLLAGCGGGGGGGGGTTSPTAASTYWVGGSVTGLPAGQSVTLLDNGVSGVDVSADGTFQFPDQLANGANYAITIGAQPTTGSVCAVTDGMGMINGQDVLNIAVTCSPPNVIGGTISGLTTGSLTLLDNSTDPVTVSSAASSNGTISFQFPTELATGQAYTVTVQTQPTGETCTVSGGTGVAGSPSSPAITVQCGTGKTEYVYVANQTASSLSAYSIGSTGTLAPDGSSLPNLPQFPTALAVDSTGTTLYVANDSPANSVSAYAINPGGSLSSPGVTTSTGNDSNSYAVTVSPQGFVYVANSGQGVPGTVSGFNFASSTGFSPLAGSPFSAGINPESVAVNPAGTFAFVANFGGDTISVYAIDPTTGALSQVGSVATGVNPFDIAINPEGTFLYAANYGSANVSVYSISSKGVLSPIAGSPFAAGTKPFSVAINPAGTFAYVVNEADNTISTYAINPTSGALTAINSTTGTGASPHAIAIDPTGEFAYVANYSGNTISEYKITTSGPSAGTLSSNGSMPVPAGSGPNAVVIAQP